MATTCARSILSSNRLVQYLRAVEGLDRFADEHYGKQVIDLAVRWALGQPGVSVALWGARHPEQLAPVDHVTAGWKLDVGTLDAIDSSIRDTVTDPVRQELVAPSAQSALAAA